MKVKHPIPDFKPKVIPDVKPKVIPDVKPKITPAVKMRRTAKPSPSVKPPPSGKSDVAAIETDTSKSPKKSSKKTASKTNVENGNDGSASQPIDTSPDMERRQSDKHSPAVSEVLDETVAKLIDLEIDEPVPVRPSEDKSYTSIRSSSSPSPTLDATIGLQSKLNFNTLNLKKVTFNKLIQSFIFLFKKNIYYNSCVARVCI